MFSAFFDIRHSAFIIHYFYFNSFLELDILRVIFQSLIFFNFECRIPNVEVSSDIRHLASVICCAAHTPFLNPPTTIFRRGDLLREEWPEYRERNRY